MSKLHYVKDNDYPIEGDYLCSKPLMVFISDYGDYQCTKLDYCRYNFGYATKDISEEKEKDLKDKGYNDYRILGFNDILPYLPFGKRIVAWVDISEYTDEYNEFAKKENKKTLESLRKK